MSKELIKQLEALTKAEKLEGDDLGIIKTVLEELTKAEELTETLAKAEALTKALTKELEEIKKGKDDKPPTTEDILKSADAKFKPQLEAILKSNEAQAKELEEIKKSQVKQLAEAKQREFIAKAESFSTLPIASEQLGAIMLTISTMDEAVSKAFDEFLTKSAEIVKKSEVLAELGTSAPGRAPKGMAAIEKKAEEILKSADGKLTKEQAAVRAMEENPELYDACEAERQEV